MARIPLIDRVHDTVHHQGRLVAQLREAHVGLPRGERPVRVPVQPVLQFDRELRRRVGIEGLEGVEYPGGRNYREAGRAREAAHGGFDTHHILSTVRLAGEDVRGAQVDVFDRCGEEDVHGLVEGDLHAVRLRRALRRGRLRPGPYGPAQKQGRKNDLFHRLFFVFCGRVRFRKETAPPHYFLEINNSRYPAFTVILTSRSREAAYCVPPVIAPRTRSMATC